MRGTDRPLVLDAGALIAIDRGSPLVAAVLDRARHAPPVVLAPIIARAWRDGATQARLARFLRQGADVVGYDESLARRAGELLARTGLADVVDAGVAVMAERVGGVVVTGDRDDLVVLAAALEARSRPRVIVLEQFADGG